MCSNRVNLSLCAYLTKISGLANLNIKLKRQSGHTAPTAMVASGTQHSLELPKRRCALPKQLPYHLSIDDGLVRYWCKRILQPLRICYYPMATSGHSKISTAAEFSIEPLTSDISARVPGKSPAPGVCGIAITSKRGRSLGGSATIRERSRLCLSALIVVV